MLNTDFYTNKSINLQHTKITKNTEKTRANTPQLLTLQKDTVSFGSKSKILNSKDVIDLALTGLEQVATRRFNDFNIMCERIFGAGNYKARLKSETSMSRKIEIELEKGIPVSKSHIDSRITDLAASRSYSGSRPQDINQIVANIKKEVKQGNLRLEEIRNYHGDNIEPYLTNDNMAAMIEATNQPIKVSKGKGKTSEGGYTSAHILGLTKEGLRVEFQVKGKHMKDIDDATHILHDIDLAKIAKSNIKSSTIRKNLKQILEDYEQVKANPQKNRQYNIYLRNKNAEARIAEIEERAPREVSYPNCLPESLKIELLAHIARQFKLA